MQNYIKTLSTMTIPLNSLWEESVHIRAWLRPCFFSRGLSLVIQENGRVSGEDEKRVCSRWTCLQREHIFKNFHCSTRELAKWVSKPVNGVSEQSERSKAKRCRLSEQSERCERTNVASDWVARSKRDCLQLETPSDGLTESHFCPLVVNGQYSRYTHA